MDTYHHGFIIPTASDGDASYSSVSPTSSSSSKTKLQWLALLLPAVAALCIYICLRVRHARRHTKQQYNCESSYHRTSTLSHPHTNNGWFIPSHHHHYHHRHHFQQQRGLPLIRFPDQQQVGIQANIQHPMSAHYGSWRRYYLHQPDCATMLHGRRHRHPHQRRRRRRRPRTPPPAYYPEISLSSPPPSYEDIMQQQQQQQQQPQNSQRLSDDDDPLAHIHSILHLNNPSYQTIETNTMTATMHENN